MFTILGSGFGMYGYLPALILHAKKKVILPSKYLPVLQSRSDIIDFIDDVTWVETLDEALTESNSIVVALAPKAQQDFFLDVSRIKNISNIILEKPITTDPLSSIDLLARLKKNNKKVRIGFSFFYTSWYKNILELTKKNEYRLQIKWSFCANHFAKNINSWKRYHSEGGGVIRFYGIHLIALFSALELDEIIESKVNFFDEDQIYFWEGIIKNGNKYCDFIIDSKSLKNQFSVVLFEKDSVKEIVNMADPFGADKNLNQTDCRVPILAKIINSFIDEDLFYDELYDKICKNWLNIENKTNFIKK